MALLGTPGHSCCEQLPSSRLLCDRSGSSGRGQARVCPLTISLLTGYGKRNSGDIRSLRRASIADVPLRRGRRTLSRRRATVVQMSWGRVEAPKPSFVPFEPIGGEEELDRILREAQGRNQPIIIYWVAAWCRKCIYLKPKMEKLAAEYYPDIKFYAVDVNKVPQSLVKRADVTKMPTIQLWKDGKWWAEIIGGHQAFLVLDEVREMIGRQRA